MNLWCHPSNKHHIQGYRNVPSRGCQEVDGCKPDMPWLQHRTAAFSSLSLPRILAQPSTWASVSSPVCTPAPTVSPAPVYIQTLALSAHPYKGHSNTGDSHLPYILELLPGLLVDSGRQPAPGSKAARDFLASLQVFLPGILVFLDL